MTKDEIVNYRITVVFIKGLKKKKTKDGLKAIFYFCEGYILGHKMTRAIPCDKLLKLSMYSFKLYLKCLEKINQPEGLNHDVKTKNNS